MTATLTTLRIAFVAALALALSPIPAAAQQCGCSDQVDLHARYCKARQAIDEWTRLVEATQNAERRAGKIEPLTPAGKDEVKHCVDEVINVARREFASTVASMDPSFYASDANAGETDKNCEVTYTAKTACMKHIILTHENLHVVACKLGRGQMLEEWGSLADWFNYRTVNGQSLVDYMLEEMHGYQTEMGEITKQLQKMQDKCPFVKKPDKDPKKRKFTVAPCPEFKRADYKLTCAR